MKDTGKLHWRSGPVWPAEARCKNGDLLRVESSGGRGEGCWLAVLIPADPATQNRIIARSNSIWGAKYLANFYHETMLQLAASAPSRVQKHTDSIDSIRLTKESAMNEQKERHNFIHSLIRIYQDRTPAISETRRWSEIPKHIDMLIEELKAYKREEGIE